MPSPRYSYLVSRLAELRRRLLPRKFSPTGSYTNQQYDKVMAYRLLAHAEIESYLEDRARDVAGHAFTKWTLTGRPRNVIVSLMAFHLQQEPLNAHKMREILGGSRLHISDSVKSATQSYHKMLAKNNGIKEENVLRILLPLGFEGTDIDSVWLSTVHAFGTRRGETAHSSIRTQQPPDPATELQTVSNIEAGLKRIDDQLN